MKIALVAQHATPLHPRTGAGPYSDDIGLSELARKLAAHGHQVTVFAQKHQPDLPVQAELHDGVRVTHINAGPVPADGDRDDASLLERVPAFSGPLRSCWERDRPDVVHALRWTSGARPGWPGPMPRWSGWRPRLWRCARSRARA